MRICQEEAVVIQSWNLMEWIHLTEITWTMLIFIQINIAQLKRRIFTQINEVNKEFYCRNTHFDIQIELSYQQDNRLVEHHKILCKKEEENDTLEWCVL